ncbi:acetyl-CoA carboxylase biotin carboxyl carrier protein [Halobacillus massiliensis]|uniref:acetyl-CoA carboxylase biotin carboxyl carrier protein n=1 Tax=Halobacillus massiliensis TaxID=1926286 RepID=UPI0009E2832D|nr:acetyl-CoA carboxylase biotin carboxyl carrier protein [Halobacillus massiliensis]
MLKVQEIRELIKLIDQSQIDEFSYESNGTKVCMKKSNGAVVTEAAPAVQEQPKPQAEPVQQPAQETSEKPAPKEESKPEDKSASADYDKEITSPMVGTFYKSPSPDQDAYVKVGDQVKQESVVCIVEAMKLFNEIEAEVSGEIVEILVNDGELVEYGQPLFRVKTA